MEKMTKIKIMLLDGSQISTSDGLDIGNHYYLLCGQNVQAIKKSDVAQITWETKEPTTDNSKYLGGDNGSCTTKHN